MIGKSSLYRTILGPYGKIIDNKLSMCRAENIDAAAGHLWAAGDPSPQRGPKYLEILRPEVDRRLDELVSGWSQTQRLDDVQAEAMRQEILFAVEELPAGW